MLIIHESYSKHTNYKQHSYLTLNGDPAGGSNDKFQSSFTAVAEVILRLPTAALY